MLTGNILEEIHRVRYGKSIEFGNHTEFFKELGAYQRSLERTGKPSVSLPAIRSWLAAGRRTSPKRADAMRFLHGYLEWIRSKGLVKSLANPELETLERLLSRFERAPREAVQTLRNLAFGDQAEALEPVVARTLHSLIAASNKNTRPVSNDLFHDSGAWQEKDHSYFLLYRYSTNNGAILKSFLVCQKPEKNIMSNYGFNQFIWGGRQPEFRQHIYRECEGIIMSFPRAYYFLGYNYMVPADKRRDPELYRKLRPEAKENPNGMVLIAAEYDDINLRPGLFGGITMTLAAASQPIVARVAFVHLGTRSRLGVEVRDEDVEPTELYAKDVAPDLRNVVERLKAKGSKRLGLELAQRTVRSNWLRKGSTSLARDIVRIIDNTPKWERTSKARERHSSANRTESWGALEIFGHLRD